MDSRGYAVDAVEYILNPVSKKGDFMLFNTHIASFINSV